MRKCLFFDYKNVIGKNGKMREAVIISGVVVCCIAFNGIVRFFSTVISFECTGRASVIPCNRETSGICSTRVANKKKNTEQTE